MTSERPPSELAASQASPDVLQRVLNRLGRIVPVVLIIGTIAGGIPSGYARRSGVIALLTVGTVVWLATISTRVSSQRLLGFGFTVFGLSGAALDLLVPSGPGFVAAYVAIAGLGLRLRRPVALVLGLSVLATDATVQSVTNARPLAAVLNIALGAVFLFLSSAFAAVSRDAHLQMQALLEERESARLAREEAAVLAERGRLARELHDVLAHTLSGLSVQLAGARLLAAQTGADPRVASTIRDAQRLTREGMSSAKHAVAALRGSALPHPGMLPALIDRVHLTGGVKIALNVSGEPPQLTPEVGLTVYRTAQEALTNAVKYAGRGARADVELRYEDDQIGLRVTDRGGQRTPESARAEPASGGYGLTGLAERAALLGGHLEAGPTPDGWRVDLHIPYERPGRDGAR